MLVLVILRPATIVIALHGSSYHQIPVTSRKKIEAYDFRELSDLSARPYRKRRFLLETHPFLRGENAVSFQGVCIGKKTKKRGGTSKNQNLPLKIRLAEVQTIQVEVWCCHLGG